jgi:hypothetical protein
MRDEEEHVEATEQDRLNRQEVARNDAAGLSLQELAPARAAAPRRRLKPSSIEKTSDTGRRDREAELSQLTADPAVSPARVLARKP